MNIKQWFALRKARNKLAVVAIEWMDDIFSGDAADVQQSEIEMMHQLLELDDVLKGDREKLFSFLGVTDKGENSG